MHITVDDQASAVSKYLNLLLASGSVKGILYK